jgi:GTP-binding protein Era
MSLCGHIALAGGPNVGKSSLLNALVGQPLAIVSPKPQATRLPVVGLRTDADAQYVFHDLPGLLDPGYPLQAGMLAAAHAALERADLVLHLHPALEAPAPAFATIARLPHPLRASLLLGYTKGDLVSAERQAELTGSGAVVVSAATGTGLDSLITKIRSYLPVRDFEFDPDDVGTQPLRFFVVEYLREAAFELLEEELPYALTAEVEEFREDERPMYIRVTLFVERESQKGMVIGRGGRTLKAIGQRARSRLEELVQAPVYLDLWVKTLPHWRQDPAALARFGFPLLAKEVS